MDIWSCGPSFNDRASLLILPQTNEPRMPEMVVRSPLPKLELPYQFGLEPPAFPHFRGGQSYSPASAVFLGKIRERASRSLQSAKSLHQSGAGLRSEPIARAGGIEKPRAFVVSEDKRIEGSTADRARCARVEAWSISSPLLAIMVASAAGLWKFIPGKLFALDRIPVTQRSDLYCGQR